MLQSNSLSSVASNYELPEEGNENCLKRLGKDVEMKTFTTNEEFLAGNLVLTTGLKT